MGSKSSRIVYRVDEAATRAAREAEEAADRAREKCIQYQVELLLQLQESRREADRRAEEALVAKRKAEEQAAAAAAAFEEERVTAANKVAEERAAATAALVEERTAAATKLEATLKEAERQAEKARKEAIKKERIRAHEERQREWAELNRDYPIPEHLDGFVTGILCDVDADAAADRFVNVGIIGESGTGKSSLIRELVKQFGCTHEEQPLISFESDGTAAPTPYVVPGFNEKVRLWDLPGQGTERFPSASYLKDMGLKYFDALLVATDGRWKTNDSILLDAIRFAGIWFKVVRTKIDLAVESAAYDHGMSQELALQQAKASLEAQLVNVTDARAVHLVTTRRMFWIGAHGGTPYGLVSTLCDEVAEYIENHNYRMPDADPRVEGQEVDDFEVLDNVAVDEHLNFEAQAEQSEATSSSSSTISVKF